MSDEELIKLQARRVEVFYEQAITSITVTLLASIILLFVFWEKVSTTKYLVSLLFS